MNWWDKKAWFYSFARKPWPLSAIYKKETESIKLMLHRVAIENPIVLDVGCGVGFSSALLNCEWNIFAIDNSLSMAKKASSTRQIVVAADVLNLPFMSQTFHLITCIGVSEYIKDLDLLLEKIFYFLKEDGCLILTISPNSIFTCLRKMGGPKIYPRTAESVLVSSTAFFNLEMSKHLFSMDVFLFRRK